MTKTMRSKLRQTLAVFATAVTTAWMTTSALASPPYVNYQGTINDAAGNPINNQSQALVFNIYDAPTGGALVWGPFSVTAPVLNGRFNVILGPTDSTARSLDTVFAGSDARYLGVTVGSTPITPRQRFLSNPYSFSASIVANSRYELTPTNFALLSNSTLEIGKGIPSKAPGNGIVSYGNDSLNIVGGGPTTDSRLTTIQGNLSITGSILDASGKTNAFATGEESLRIVRGRVSGRAVADGSGFTVGIARTNGVIQNPLSYTGPFTVKFDLPFSGRPVITVTAGGDDTEFAIPVIERTTTTNAVIHLHHLNSQGTWQDTVSGSFHFIAIGPR
jgi:hypothetical protein